MYLIKSMSTLTGSKTALIPNLQTNFSVLKYYKMNLLN